MPSADSTSASEGAVKALWSPAVPILTGDAWVFAGGKDWWLCDVPGRLLLLVLEVPGRLLARLPWVVGRSVLSAVRRSLADAEEPGLVGLSWESSLEKSFDMSTDEATEFSGVRSPPPSPARPVADVPTVPDVARLAAVPG